MPTRNVKKRPLYSSLLLLILPVRGSSLFQFRALTEFFFPASNMRWIHWRISTMANVEECSGNGDSSSTIFTQLKNLCVQLLELLQNPKKSSSSPSQLLQLIRHSPPDALQPFFEYVFPLCWTNTLFTCSVFLIYFYYRKFRFRNLNGISVSWKIFTEFIFCYSRLVI